ncbi:MAG: S1 RNA-binding domain-containing protein [Candidatus Kapaibacterium sp.]
MAEEQENISPAESPEVATNVSSATVAPSSTSSESAIADNDPIAHLRKASKQRENVMAKVIKWQRNGLEMELEDGTRGFMPNDMIDRDPNRNIANYFGKTLPVRITSIKGNGKKAEIALSHRAVIEDDLRTQGRERMETINVGDTIEGKVRSFNNIGAVIDIGPGVDAVVRTQDLSWETFTHPYEVVQRGAMVNAKVLHLDKQRRRVTLGIRQLTGDPYLERFSKYPVGHVQNAKVVGFNDYGAQVEFEPGIQAYLPVSEIAWHHIPTASSALKEGEEIEVKVTVSDPESRRLTVSKKQLVENPQRLIESTYKVGTDHNGTIKEVTKGGIVVEFPGGAEGFVPRRELSHDRIERLEDVFKLGKPLEGLRVIEYDRRNGKVTLSYIAAEREAQRTTLKNYKATSSASSFAIGDLASLKEKLEKIERGG